MDSFLNDMGDQDKPDEALYYIENGLIVFTAAYHLKRGYCCKSGCRHCPYDRKSAKRDQTSGRGEFGGADNIKQ